MNPKINPLAFPQPKAAAFDLPQVGLTKRELFAALIMPQLLQGQGFSMAATDAVNAADALIEALTPTSGEATR